MAAMRTVSALETVEKRMQHIACGCVLRVVTRFYDCTFTESEPGQMQFRYDHCDVTFYDSLTDRELSHCPTCGAELPILKDVPMKAERDDD